MTIDYSCIGARIKKIRKQKHISQERLAEKMSVTVGYVSQLERGITKINLETLAAIASILECEICFFIEGTAVDNKQYYCNELTEQIEKMNPEQRRLLSAIAGDILAADI